MDGWFLVFVCLRFLAVRKIYCLFYSPEESSQVWLLSMFWLVFRIWKKLKRVRNSYHFILNGQCTYVDRHIRINTYGQGFFLWVPEKKIFSVKLMSETIFLMDGSHRKPRERALPLSPTFRYHVKETFPFSKRLNRSLMQSRICTSFCHWERERILSSPRARKRTHKTRFFWLLQF